MFMVKLNWLNADPRWGSDIWINMHRVQAIFRAPHHALDKTENCTRICMGDGETQYYDVTESVEEIRKLCPSGVF